MLTAKIITGVINGIKNGLPVLSNIPNIQAKIESVNYSRTTKMIEILTSVFTAIAILYLTVKTAKGELDSDTAKELIKLLQ